MSEPVTYAKLRATINPLLEEFLQGAEKQEWPCMPETWQFRNSGNQHDLRTLLMTNNNYQDHTEYQVLKQCLKHAMQEKLYGQAMAIVFVLDRFSYWLHRDETKELLDTVQEIIENAPEVAIPPQVLVRKARVLKDDGALQIADQLLAYILQQGLTGIWPYATRNQYLTVASNVLGIRGQIRYNLGIWKDAVHYLVGSIHIANILKSPDEKSLSISLQILTDILCHLSVSDYTELQESLQFQCDDPLLQADLYNRQSAYLVKPDRFYYPARLMKGSAILLSRYKESGMEDFLDTAIDRMKLAVLIQAEEMKTRDRLHDLTMSLFTLSECYQLKGDSREHHLLDLCHSIYCDYCMKIWPLPDSKMERMRASLGDVTAHELLDDQVNYCEPVEGFEYPQIKDNDPITWVLATELDVHKNEITEHVDVTVEVDNDEESTVDPKAKTRVREPTTMISRRQPGILSVDITAETDDETVSTISDGTSYQNHLSISSLTPIQQLEEIEPIHLNIDPSLRILETNLQRNKTYNANLVKYHPVDNQWCYQPTLVYVEDELELTRKKGSFRDVIKIHFLHQEEAKGQYLGKRYRLKNKPKSYHDDIVIHQISRYYITLFNQALQPYPELANQIQMVPAVHLEILDDNRQIIELLNAEPYIDGKFQKITNNYDFVNTRIDTNLLLAFSHFTWCHSMGKLIVTDLQGWVPKESGVPVILTDPAINSHGISALGVANMAELGMEGFWNDQHKQCNHICEKLGLRRFI